VTAEKLEHVFEIRIKGSIQAVWDEITKRGAVQRPLMDTVLVTDLKPGSPFKYLSPNHKYCLVHGKVLEVDPPRRLVHTYQFTIAHDPPSRVTWELDQIGDEVRVRLVHDQFETPTKTFKQVKGGWAGILQSLKLWIETGDIAFTTKLQYAMFKPMMPFLPKQCREMARS
jgi:uncharacterized protein YndB with AHSA1/START domain